MPNKTTTNPKSESVETPVPALVNDAAVQPVANTEDAHQGEFVAPVFEDAEVPTVTRPRAKAPNVFSESIKALAARTDAWKQDETGTAKQPAQRFQWPSKDLKKARRLLSDAGNDLDTPVTVKWSTANESTASATVTVWVVDKQRRPGAGNHGKNNK